MNNNILHLWTDSQTFPSQVLWMLRLQSAPAEQLPAVEELCGADKLSSTGEEGLPGPPDPSVQMHGARCYRLRKLVLQARKEGQRGTCHISGQKGNKGKEEVPSPAALAQVSSLAHFLPLLPSLSESLLSVSRFPQQHERKNHYLAFKELNGKTFSVHSCSAFNLFLQSRYIFNQELERVASG